MSGYGQEGQDRREEFPPPQDYPQAPGQYPAAPPAGQYPAAPAYGYGPPTPAAPVEVPREVTAATNLMFGRVALGIISSVVGFSNGSSFRTAIHNARPTLTSAQVDSAYHVAVGVGLFIGLVFAVLYILLALQVRRGRNWARIVTFVLAGLSVLGGLLGLAAAAPSIDKLFSVLLLVVDAGIIVLLATKPSNRFFAAWRAQRFR